MTHLYIEISCNKVLSTEDILHSSISFKTFQLEIQVCGKVGRHFAILGQLVSFIVPEFDFSTATVPLKAPKEEKYFTINIFIPKRKYFIPVKKWNRYPEILKIVLHHFP